MTQTYKKLKKPIRLYIKQCSHCGLKYFGKCEKEDIQNYIGSGTYWINHIKKHNASSIHLWESNWYYDTQVTNFALKFSRINHIVKSKHWANLIEENGLNDGDTSNFINYEKVINKMKNKFNDEHWKETVGKTRCLNQKRTFNNPEWKKTVGLEKSKKQSNTLNDKHWKETVGKAKKEKELATKSSKEWQETSGIKQIEKFKKTISSEEWQKTVGKAKKEKELATKSSKEWQETVLKSSLEKTKKTKSSKEWQETVGLKMKKRMSKIQNDPAWKKQNHKKCKYCKKITSPGNFKRWHGDNCKFNPLNM